MFFRSGHLVMVSLTDGTAIQGITCWAWPGRIRLREVAYQGSNVPGIVTVYKRSVLLVQVVK